MIYSVFVGIDNGADGGIVAIDRNMRVVLAEPAPTINVKTKGKKRIPDVSRMADLMSKLVAAATREEVYVVLEHAQAFPREGAVSSFVYGMGFGAWQGVLAALGVRHAVVKPRAWQQKVLAGIEGTDTKARALLYVQRTLPDLKLVLPRCRTPHPGLVDAAAMALYARATLV